MGRRGGWGGAEGGGVLPKRLKSGSGKRRLKIFKPSNGRHKIAEGRPDFLASLRSLAGAIGDGLDTLNEPNAVFSQFLGSASMTFFLFSFPCFLFLSCLLLLFWSFLLHPLVFRVSLFFLLFPFLSLLIFSLFRFPS